VRDERITFHTPAPLLRDLKRGVDAYFASSGRTRFGGVRLWVKTVLLLVYAGVVWSLFLFGPGTWWVALLNGAGVGLALAGIGFCIQHDANHGAYSSNRRVNAMMSWMMDLVGASSYVWRTKHNIIHHTYTNLAGVDQDLDAGIFARFAPGMAWRKPYRFQHLYVWFLYGLLTLKWMWVDDFLDVGLGSVGAHKLRRPRGKEWGVFLVGKALSIGWTFVIPALVHGFWIGLLFHLSAHFVAGVTLSIVFQLAHCVEVAEFPPVPTPPGRDVEWAEHQLRTSVDFAPGNPLLTYFLGGLNYQAIHHLFPHVSHVHYPALRPIVAEVCEAHGVPYRTIPTFGEAVKSHYRWLRRMGRAPGED